MNVPDIFLLLVYAALLLVPGAAIGAAGGIRGWQLAGVAVPLTYGAVAVTGPLTAGLHVTWSFWALLLAIVLFSALAGGLNLLFRRFRWSRPADAETPTAWARWQHLAVLASTLLGALIGGTAVLKGVGHLGSIPQDWDAIFHGNAVRYIADTGNASPSALAALYRYQNPAGFFYPNSYHALAAIAYELTHPVVGTDVPSVLDAQMVLLPGVTALGLVALVRTWLPRPALAIVVPLVGVAFTSFPYDVLWRGPLLPYGMGVALLPGLLLLFRHLFTGNAVSGLLMVAVGCVGMVGLHPSTAFTALPFIVALLVARAAGRPRRLLRDLPLLVTSGVLALVLGLPFVLGSLNSADSVPVFDWPASGSAGTALGDMILLEHESPHPQLWLTALVIIGLAGLRRLRGIRWFLVGAVPIGWLYVLAASDDDHWVKEITRPWWNDKWRFIAVVVLAFAVLAANGVVMASDALGGWLTGGRWWRWTDAVRDRLLPWLRRWPARRVGAASLVVVLAVFLVVSRGFYVGANAQRISVQYGDGPTVSTGKRAAMDVLARLVKPGDRVMNDRGDGSAWMYALDDVHPFLGHAISNGPEMSALSPDQQLLLHDFNQLDTNPQVRAAAKRLDLRWVFVGRGFVRPYYSRYEGLRDLDAVHSLSLVYNSPDAAIYRINLP